MKTEDRRVCPSCGNEFSGAVEFCPVCMLHGALADEVESGEASSERGIKPKSQGVTRRFQHYEVVVGEDGRPFELGRGAMGITYKAVDVDLHCHVTLKVIGEKYLGDETARLRFLREARAAAKVRHPNVASVFHLGRTGDNYFYAMEFVEGETLENLIRRSGPLEVKLALKIATQVAAGLAAVHKQELVHRDIKPSNIMVSVDEASGVVAKIIDLGLAKTTSEAGSQITISTSGGFAGTPDFASPEQFGGVDVDIRSDLYSLGVSLWQMLTGHVPFWGSPAEVMYQHQHAPLPLEQLESVPQSVVSLIEVLLDKDPRRRFQTPAELLKALQTMTGAIDEGRTITYQRLGQMLDENSYSVTREPPATLGPEKISIARLPVTGSDLFGREEDIAFLHTAWANRHINVVTIVAWAGVGKSTLVNHWLGRMAAEDYRSAELVFGWSFYRQGSSGGTSSAEEFLDAALTWFGDPDPRIGTAWEKGERLAKLIAQRRTLLILDGLEPLQNPPGPQEGRVRDPALQALLRELAGFNRGLCVVTTRMPVAEIAHHERSSAPRHNLEQLSNEAGEKLLRALGVKGSPAELQTASDEFGGHCLALTLLGSYLTDAYDGDICCRKEVSQHLTRDARQGVHARNVMKSYQLWFGEGPELSILRLLGLFDRPADRKALLALLKPPIIPGLTESLANLSPIEWRTILAQLRRANLLAREDAHNPEQLDTHPLIREYFGEELRSQHPDAWRECNRRLYEYFRTLAPPLPDSPREMEALFLAVAHGCNAGLFRQALHEVYISRIQRGEASFAANVLGARGALLFALAHFFEPGNWGSLRESGLEGQWLAAEDQLFILLQAGLYLTATRGYSAPEARSCYERVESLCRSLNRPLALYTALLSQWHSSLLTDKLSATLQLAKRLYSLALEQNDSLQMIAAYRALAGTHHFLGDFVAARENAVSGFQIWRSESLRSHEEDFDASVVACLCYAALSEWHFGEIVSSRATMAEAMSLAQELQDKHALAGTLHFAAILGQLENSPAEVERLVSRLIELSTRQNFAVWLALGEILRGWARCASGNAAEGLDWIEDGIREYRVTGSMLRMPHYLGLKAEALHLANRTPEALETIDEAGAVVERSEERASSAELLRLRGVFLAAMGANETEIETSFYEAIGIARKQKSVSLEKRAEGSYVEYRRQKESGLGGRGFRLPLC
jgi:predicted ATPase